MSPAPGAPSIVIAVHIETSLRLAAHEPPLVMEPSVPPPLKTAPEGVVNSFPSRTAVLGELWAKSTSFPYCKGQWRGVSVLARAYPATDRSRVALEFAVLDIGVAITLDRTTVLR